MKTVYFIMLLMALFFWGYNAINFALVPMWISCAFTWIAIIGIRLENINYKQNL